MPEKIGHYTIVSELGRGGMGVVYKAREESLNRFVAIKVLTEQLTEDATFLQRFVREAQAAAALSHPNIVQIFFIGEDNGHPYFVMEHVTGRSLNHLLRDEGRIENPRASQLMLQAAHGLAAAHDHGIIHRDIKPANLILDDRGLLKIADFGLALPVDAEQRLTATGMLVGTPGYLAPEQCRGEKVDHRTDIYALGVTFYLLLSGQAPFKGESPLALLRQILDEQPPDISTLNPNVDAETRRILEKMIAKDREQRYQSCHDLVTDLEDYLSKHNVRSMTAGLATRKPTVSSAAAAAAVMNEKTLVVNPSEEKTTSDTAAARVAAVAAAMPSTAAVARPLLHDSPTTIDKPTQPDSPFVEQQTAPNPPPRTPTLAGTPPPSSNKGALAVIAVAVLLLLGGAALLASKMFGAHKETAKTDTVAASTKTTSTETTASTISTSTSSTNPLLSQEVKPPAIGEGAQNTMAPTTTMQAGVQQQQQQQTTTPAQQTTPAGAALTTPQTKTQPIQRAAAATPLAPRGPAAAATPQSMEQRGTAAAPAKQSNLSGVAIAVVGDPELTGAVSSVLSSEMSAAGLNAVDADTLPATEDLVRRGEVSTSRLIDRLRAEGYAVLLLARVDPSGQRELSYMGRHDTAYSARITLITYDLASGKPFGTPAKGTIEYTSATADRESEKIVGRLARSSAEAIQNH